MKSVPYSIQEDAIFQHIVVTIEELKDFLG